MEQFNGKWWGILELNGLKLEIEINYCNKKKILNLSFPQKTQNNIPIYEYSLNNNILSFNLFDNELFGQIILYYLDNTTLKGVFQYSSYLPVIFNMIYIGQYKLGNVTYQPWPKLNKLIYLLQIHNHIDFSPTLNIQYPISNHIILQLLYNTYKLKNLLGNGSTLEQAIHLMKWVHKIIRQKGMVALPEKRDGFSLLEYAVKRKNPLNCKGCSIILTDMLLAANIKARMVHCISFDSFDPESHFITEFYSIEQKKWIAIDATFGCLFSIDNLYLSIEEIRNCLVNKEKITILSSMESIKKDKTNYIIYFLYKNFYMFEYYKKYSVGYANEHSGIEKLVINPFDF